MRNHFATLLILLTALGPNLASASKIQQQGFKTHADCIAGGATDATCLLLTAQVYDSGNSQQLSQTLAGLSLPVAPVVQTFTSGSGTFNEPYAFIISSGNATAGATYTNNAITYTVFSTVSSATLVYMTGSNTPTTSGTLTKSGGTGDATLTFSSYKAPLYNHVRMVGGGGGGAASGTSAGSPTATSGGTTSFGTSLLVANGGSGATFGNSSNATGGTASLGTGPIGTAIQGGSATGGASVQSVALEESGASGASSPFGGAGGGGFGLNGGAGNGKNAIANTGSGGGGAGVNAITNSTSGGGGAAGGFIDAIITNPTTTYAYSIGAAGGAGSNSGGGGAGSASGGAGGSGYIEVTSSYQ